MATSIQIGDRTLNAEELIGLLSSYQLYPNLLREMIIDKAIAPFICTPEETATVCNGFYQQHQITSETQRQAWLERHGLKPEHIEAIATRKLRIQKFKQEIWGNKLESYFLKRKRQIDRVVYSLLRTQDADLAHELYFRIQSGEQSFSKLAQTYSQGPEAQTGGYVGPVELGTLHPNLAHLLTVSKPGQLWSPKPLGEWITIVRLEQILPTQLNEFVRQRLLNELFENWLLSQISQLPDSDRRWLQPATTPGRDNNQANLTTAA